MPITERQLDALEQQHKEMLEAYGKKIKFLQSTEVTLTDNIRNLNTVIDNHVLAEKKILNDKIAEIEKLKLETITFRKQAQELLYTAQAKNEEATKIHEGIINAAEEYDNKIKDHVDIVSSAHKDIDNRIGQAVEKESKANDILVESNKRIQLALLAERKTQEEFNKLTSISESIKSDIEIQKNLYINNKQLLDTIRETKLEMSAIKDKSDKDMKDVLKIRDDLDIAQARITKNSEEINKRNEELKSREIQNKVNDQLLKDRKSVLDAQEGRLNELRNNVNSLLEKQQATAQPATPNLGGAQ